MNQGPSYDISVILQAEKAATSATDHEDSDPADPSGYLNDAVTAALRYHKVSEASVVVVVVDDVQIRDLNAKHLGHDSATDVLSFDMGEGDINPSEDSTKIDGEVILSQQTAEREARMRGHDLQAELCLYAVHGTLHLLGYDDQTDEDAARMHTLEDLILERMGYGKIYRPDAMDADGGLES